MESSNERWLAYLVDHVDGDPLKTATVLVPSAGRAPEVNEFGRPGMATVVFLRPDDEISAETAAELREIGSAIGSADLGERATRRTRQTDPCPDCSTDPRGLPTGYSASSEGPIVHRCETCRGTGVAPKPLTISALADEAGAYFETITRGEGDDAERIDVLKDGRPEWVFDLVHDAHGGDFLPDDWRYSKIRAALDEISETDATDADDLDDAGHEFADGAVDIYTHARLQWLASNLNRPGYCDEAVSEGLVSEEADLIDRVGVGQYMEAREIWASVVGSLADQLDA